MGLSFIHGRTLGTLRIMTLVRNGLVHGAVGLIAVMISFGEGCKSQGSPPSVVAAPTCAAGQVCCGRLAVPCPAEYTCTGYGTCENSARVYIPESPFWMGCNAESDAACEADERPYHVVRVPAFAIDRLEVTRAQYGECVSAGACTAPRGQGAPTLAPNAPVTMIDWYQAKAYCAYRGGRLPSEAEWEKAARGGCELYGAACRDKTPIYPWGDAPATCQHAAVGRGCDTRIGAGGTYPRGRSPYGALDMAGSVWEWVEDCSHDSYEGAPLDGSAWTQPCKDDVRIDRGGRNGDRSSTLRASNRSDERANNPIETVGVRCAYDT